MAVQEEWLFSIACFCWPGASGVVGDEKLLLLEWVAYILFSSCSQHILASVNHAIFLLFAISTTIKRRFSTAPATFEPAAVAADHSSRSGGGGSSSIRIIDSVCYYHTTLALAVAVSLLSLALAAFHIFHASASAGSGLAGSDFIGQLVFCLLYSLGWLTCVGIVCAQRGSGVTQHPNLLRLWWFFNFILSLLECVSAVTRLATSGLSYDEQLLVDDIAAIFTLPASLFFLVVSIRGPTGLGTRIHESSKGSPSEPLLDGSRRQTEENVTITQYWKAGLLSRAVWLWINPLLSYGAKTALEIKDVPQLPPDHTADRTCALFLSKWPDKRRKSPVRRTLLKCFAPGLAFTAFLAFLKAVLMFSGPLLIQTFVDYIESDSKTYMEGFSLVLILLIAKTGEVLSTHHYNFYSKKLGMSMRAALIPTVYRKGLRLTASERQDHGVGQIVNYMYVDVQQVADSILQLHYVWMLPLQMILAVVILYTKLGISVLAGLAIMVVCAAAVSRLSTLLGAFQIQLMKMKDLRMKATTEVVCNLKIVKLQAWEEFFLQRVEGFRLGEYGWLAKFSYSFAVYVVSALNMSTTLVSITTFATCLLLKVDLTAAKVFTAISIFNMLTESMGTFPKAVVAIFQALVSLDRLDKYMLSKETQAYVSKLPLSGKQFALTIEHGCFTWDDEGKTPTLRNIDLYIPQGSLVAIVGTVGSGKTSLLAALLGQMAKLSGGVEVCGSTAYVPQTAWIQNGTLQENILFGLSMEGAKYRKTLRACALEVDLSLLEYGDQTEIGERGINLSGGQKQRVQLARAVFQDSDVYFLDDIFSAVDAQTGSHLFQECILGVLKEKTRVLVTHQVEFLHRADIIVVMDDGEIVQSGSYTELLDAGTHFAAFVAAHKESVGKVEMDVPQQMEICAVDLQSGLRESYWKTARMQRHGSSSTNSPFKGKIQKYLSSESFSELEGKKGSSKLVAEEEREIGQVGWKVYWMYVNKAYGFTFVLLVLLVQIIAQASSICSDLWLANQTSSGSNLYNPRLFICVYIYFCIGNWVFTFVRALLMTAFSLKTSQTFFLEMLHSIFEAPMSFLDTTPTGRILTRFSTDQSTLDMILPISISFALLLYSATVGTLIVACYVTWPVIFVVLPLAGIYFWYQGFYIASSREIARLDFITKAPVIDHFTETIAGFMVIHGFEKVESFLLENLKRVNDNLKMDFHFNAANEWIGFRLEMIGTIVLCSATVMFVVLPESWILPEFAALSLSYLLSLNVVLSSTILFTCDIENKMVSAERIAQFTRIPREAPRTSEGCPLSKNWPHTGHIRIKDLKARYQPDSPLVLKGISLVIEGGHKIGVVGRTGSGKSTLIQVLFRIIEPAGGQILIDEVDISLLGLHDLRSKLAIIPQEPVLFEGTVRTNMDPLGVYTDDMIWEGLRKCQLAEIVEGKAEKLDAEVTENGGNWSVGQRQLLCLGRALLKQSRILFLDEATASVDSLTDAVLQKIIREEFNSSTVVSIAHRIPTVMDYEKIVVLDAGSLKEYDSPAKLLQQQPPSLFSALVHEYSSRSRGSHPNGPPSHILPIS